MCTYRHHPSTGGSFHVKKIKIVLQVLEVGGVGRGWGIKAHDVVIADGIRNDGKWFAVHCHRKRLVPADIVDVIDETQLLKNAQGVRRAAQPERVETNRTRACDFLNRIDAGLIPSSFLFRGHGILRLPCLSVPGGFMSPFDNFLCKIRMLLNCLTDHMRSYFDSDAVPQIEHTRNAFLETIVVPFLNGEIGVFRIERWKGTTGSSFGLSACFELHGK